MPEIPSVIQKADTEVFCYRLKKIETDRKNIKRQDGVLPIYPGSGVHYILDHLLVQSRDLVLDLCTGSGILGIFAAEKASRVICTDISSRALNFAKRNAQVNNIQNIEFRCGDLFEPVQGEQFDYIVTNPPFVPIPDGLSAALHTDGGSDGLVLIRRIFEQAELHLKPDGIMQVYSLSLGNKKESLLEQIIRQNLRNRKVTMMSMYLEPLPLNVFTKDFEQFGINYWKQQMAERKLTHLYAYIVKIEPNNHLEVSHTVLPESERATIPDNWVNWRERFSYWILGTS